jgi:hypothetical protein
VHARSLPFAPHHEEPPPLSQATSPPPLEDNNFRGHAAVPLRRVVVLLDVVQIIRVAAQQRVVVRHRRNRIFEIAPRIRVDLAGAELGQKGGGGVQDVFEKRCVALDKA